MGNSTAERQHPLLSTRYASRDRIGAQRAVFLLAASGYSSGFSPLLGGFGGGGYLKPRPRGGSVSGSLKAVE